MTKSPVQFTLPIPLPAALLAKGDVILNSPHPIVVVTSVEVTDLGVAVEGYQAPTESTSAVLPHEAIVWVLPTEVTL